MKKNPVKKEDILDIYVDGASRGNPGPSAWAYIFKVESKTVSSNSEFIGHATNNEAEYQAIINALSNAKGITRWHARVYSDSELVIKHIKGEYRIRASNLAPLLKEVYSLRNFFETLEFFRVGRNNKDISQCDILCNKCLDEKGL